MHTQRLPERKEQPPQPSPPPPCPSQTSRRPGAFLWFFGWLPYAFDKLVEAFTAACPLFARPHRGRPPYFDAQDHVAILLTYLTTRCDVEDLIKIFPSVPSVFKTTLTRAKIYMLRAMESFAPARIVYPTREEALACDEMLTAVYGPCPVELRGPLWGYLDGMALPVLGCGIEEEDDKFAAGMQGKGVCINNIFLFAVNGLICDGSVGWPGCYHDSRASESLFKRLHDPDHNPNATDGCVATDVGFIGFTSDGVVRPLHSSDRPSSPAERKLWETVSAHVTIVRQGNERGNGLVRGAAWV